MVEDTPEQLVTWLPLGSVRQVPADGPVAPGIASQLIGDLHRGHWEFTDSVWPCSTLAITKPGEWHSTWVSWLPDGSRYGWYVNLQMPAVRTPLGYEAMDLMLDVVVSPERQWSWKDQDHFDEARALGLYDDALADRVLSEAEAVIEQVEAGAAPFDGTWLDWEPPADWGPAELPVDWETLSSPVSNPAVPGSATATADCARGS